jgi:hypothetical protein
VSHAVAPYGPTSTGVVVETHEFQGIDFESEKGTKRVVTGEAMSEG